VRKDKTDPFYNADALSISIQEAIGVGITWAMPYDRPVIETMMVIQARSEESAMWPNPNA
jgi:hypothetical protein